MDYDETHESETGWEVQDGKVYFEEDRLYDCYTLGNSDNNLLPGQRHTGRSDAGGHQGASRGCGGEPEGPLGAG